MRTDLFDFELPQERIALRPISPRDAARLLVVKQGGALDDRKISDLPMLLEAGDQLVVNDTRVLPAHLAGRRLGREPQVGPARLAHDDAHPGQAPDAEPKIEATLIKRLDGSRWQA